MNKTETVKIKCGDTGSEECFAFKKYRKLGKITKKKSEKYHQTIRKKYKKKKEKEKKYKNVKKRKNF